MVNKFRFPKYLLKYHYSATNDIWEYLGILYFGGPVDLNLKTAGLCTSIIISNKNRNMSYIFILLFITHY